MFLGLKNILELNRNNNTILEIEASRDDGSKVFATFSQFILLEEAVDDITYHMYDGQTRNRNEMLYAHIRQRRQCSASPAQQCDGSLILEAHTLKAKDWFILNP